MATYVCSGAQMKCSMGSGNANLVVLPERRIFLGSMPKANISDMKSMTNIPSFGLCFSLANPVVAAATAAHLGVLTPMPCIPNPSSPWEPGKQDVLEQGQPALLNTCKLQCQWAGTIELVTNGQE